MPLPTPKTSNNIVLNHLSSNTIADIKNNCVKFTREYRPFDISCGKFFSLLLLVLCFVLFWFFASLFFRENLGIYFGSSCSSRTHNMLRRSTRVNRCYIRYSSRQIHTHITWSSSSRSSNNKNNKTQNVKNFSLAEYHCYSLEICRFIISCVFCRCSLSLSLHRPFPVFCSHIYGWQLLSKYEHEH